MTRIDPSGHYHSDSTPLGILLRRKREAARLSLGQLAKEVGVSRPYLSRLERGAYANPSARVLGQVIKRLDISAEDVYAASGFMLPRDLPSFGPYLHAKHADWPEAAIRELEASYDFVKYKYSHE